MQHNIIPKAGQSSVMSTPVLIDRHSSSLRSSLCLPIFCLAVTRVCKILLQDLVVWQQAPKCMGASKAGYCFCGFCCLWSQRVFLKKNYRIFFFYLVTRLPLDLLIKPANCGVQKQENVIIPSEDIVQK